MEETDYSELFGVEQDMPGEGGAEGNSTGSEAGAEAQEVTDPAVKDGAEKTETGTSENATGAAGTGGSQSPEENARYAAARRKAEQERDAAVQKAKDDAKAELEGVIQSLGLKDPYTKKPITTREEFQAYRQQFEIEKKAAFLKKSGMSEEEFQKFVNELPEVKEAAAKKKEAEESAQSAREAQAKIEVDNQIAEIAKDDPSITSIAELAEAMRKAGKYDEFYGKVKKGYSLTDAYRLATMDTRAEKNISQTKQAALNAANSKNHLDRTTTRGAGAVTVPAEIMEQYRAFNPGISDAEIQAHYTKYKK